MKTHTNLKTILISFILIIFLKLPIDSFSQGLFRSGVLITNQNDSIKGYVKYEDWTTSPVSIQFKNVAGQINSFSVEDIKEFHVESPRLKFESRKIGLIGVALNENYREITLLVVKDSVQAFLKVLVSGYHASLYLYLDEIEIPHYFLLTKTGLVELYNYRFPRRANDRNYVIEADLYKQQLEDLAKESPGFSSPIPPYQEKYLRQYIEEYNKSFAVDRETFQSEKELPTLDFDLNTGLESWDEEPVVIRNRLTFGLGLRVNFPGKLYKRFVKANLFWTPGTDIGYDLINRAKVDLKTWEVAVGSYLGNGLLQPYVAFQYSGVGGSYRLDFVGFQGGVSLKRRLTIEVGHFANLWSAITETSFWTPPRLSLHYLFNLSFKSPRRSPH